MNTRRSRRPILTIGLVCLCIAAAWADQGKTVIGPSNPELTAGAEALLAGDAEEGVRLTLIGLRHEASVKDRLTGMSNLCAGYIMLERYDAARDYCDRVLAVNDRHWRAYSNRALLNVRLGNYEEAERDLKRAEQLAPGARTVKVVRSLLQDKVDPVAPSIIIDDRRVDAGDDDDTDE